MLKILIILYIKLEYNYNKLIIQIIFQIYSKYIQSVVYLTCNIKLMNLYVIKYNNLYNYHKYNNYQELNN